FHGLLHLATSPKVPLHVAVEIFMLADRNEIYDVTLIVDASLRSAVARRDAQHALNDISKPLVVVDVPDAPRVMEASPARSPGPDPAGERFLEFQRTCDKRIVRGCLRWNRRKSPQAEAPGAELGCAREAHLHMEVAGHVGEGGALFRA